MITKKARIVNTIYNKDNNSTESDVIYIADFLTIFDTLKDIRKSLNELDNDKDTIRDRNWDDLLLNINKSIINFRRYLKDNDLEQIEETTVTGGEGYLPKLKTPIMKKYLTEEDSQLDFSNMDSSKRAFIEKRLNSYNEIEKGLTIIIELLKKRKKEDEIEYMNNPSYQILTPTETVLEYLKDIITLIK